MNDDDQAPELSSQEQEALRSLSRERQPSPALEDRVVSALRHQGLVRSPGAFWSRTLPRFAAAAVLIWSLGFAAGRWIDLLPSSETDLQRFILLLYETPEREASRTVEEERTLAAEYGAWAGEIARAGHLLSGDPIHGEARMLRLNGQQVEALPPPSENGEVGEIVVGYFMIQATDYDQALEIAEECPHLKYDGGVLVRRVGPV